MGEESALPTSEVRPDDLQDTILTAVGDALTAPLEEVLAVESAAQFAMVQLAEAKEQAESTDAEGKPADAVPTQSKT